MGSFGLLLLIREQWRERALPWSGAEAIGRIRGYMFEGGGRRRERWLDRLVRKKSH